MQARPADPALGRRQPRRQARSPIPGDAGPGHRGVCVARGPGVPVEGGERLSCDESIETMGTVVDGHQRDRGLCGPSSIASCESDPRCRGSEDRRQPAGPRSRSRGPRARSWVPEARGRWRPRGAPRSRSRQRWAEPERNPSGARASARPPAELAGSVGTDIRHQRRP